jgi:hypothetical protein
LQAAVNRPAGIVTLFWIGSLVLWRKHQEVTKPTGLGNDANIGVRCRPSSTTPTLSGTASARSVLASRLALLMAVDETWTRQCLAAAVLGATDRL